MTNVDETKTAPKKADEEAADNFLQDDGEGGHIVNWDDVPEAGDFPVLPKGWYNLTVSEVEYKLSDASGMPMWAMVLEVAEGDENTQNRKVFHNMSFSPKALPFTKKALAVLAPECLVKGFKPENVGDYGIEGRTVSCRLGIRKGNDQYPNDRNEIKQWRPATGTAGNAFMQP